ncbi:MAG TPA: DNRLRE domain-containing protein [Candidatus Sulfotelmatobacter sp.]
MKSLLLKVGGKRQILSALVLFLGLFSWTEAYGQITPLSDAYTNTATPTTNYGTKTLLDVDEATQTTYIQFDLSSVPAGTSVDRATLKLYVNSITTAGSFTVNYVDGTWAESTITSSLAPALGTTIATSPALTAADKNQYILINITPAVQAWLDGSQANDGVALVANGSFNATFDSKENASTSHAAELDIVFAGGNGTITGVTTASSSGLEGGGTSGTLNLALSNCAANQVLQSNGSAWGCANAGTGTINGVLPGTGMSGGGTNGTVTLTNTGVLSVTAGSGIALGGTGQNPVLGINPAVVPGLSASNTFTANQTINGNLTATGTISGQFGIYSANANGYALAAVNGGSGVAVVGSSTSASNGVGVEGTSTAGTGLYGIGGLRGVEGDSNGVGVLGFATSATGLNYGVYGQTPSPSGFAVEGNAVATSGSPIGVFGAASSPSGYAVMGYSYASAGQSYGVSGQNNSGQGYGVAGMNFGEGGTGVWAIGGGGPSSVNEGTGLVAQGGFATGPSAIGGAGVVITGGGVSNSSSTPGVGAFIGGGTCTSCSPGQSMGGTGIVASGANGSDADGIEAFGSNWSQSFAGDFVGDINVTGAIFAHTKDFKIDHPLDPANKYLYHASVESSEMMNIYTGNVTTDAQGEAMVQLPDWFEVLNTDFRYQVTVIGQFAQAIVAREISDHAFTIRTNIPNVKVSWQVTGVRQDAYAKAHPLVVEKEKEDRLKGFYLDPELYGATEEKGIEWARHPEIMRRIKEMRDKQQAGPNVEGLPRSSAPSAAALPAAAGLPQREKAAAPSAPGVH